MRIEIIIDNSDPQIYPLNKPKLLIGSNENCDIVLPYDGVSRKHLVVLSENDNYYVIDQGSSNGTYINEERLVPGNRVQFTSFFPVRISGNILVSLLSDEEGSQFSFTEPLESFAKKEVVKSSFTSSSPTSSLQDATKAISLKDLQQSNTEKLIKQRTQSLSKKKVEALPKKNQDLKRMKIVFLICFVAFGAAAYFNLSDKPTEERENANSSQDSQSNSNQNKQDVVVPPKFKLVDESVLLPKSKYPEILKGMACTTDVELHFCQKIKAEEKFTVQMGTSLYVFFESGDYVQKARALIPEVPLHDEKTVEKYSKDLLLTATLLYFYHEFPRDLNYSLFKDLNLIFVMKVKLKDDSTDYVTLAIHSDTLEKFLLALEERHFKAAQKYGADALALFKEYFRFY